MQGMAMRFAAEARRQLAIEDMRHHAGSVADGVGGVGGSARTASTSEATVTTPSNTEDFGNDYGGEGDMCVDEMYNDLDAGGDDLPDEMDGRIEYHLMGWRHRRCLRIQSSLRRAAAVRNLRHARWAATVIQAAARARTARLVVLRRRAAAALITRIGRGRRGKLLARRRREAATIITRIAKGHVSRKLLNGVAASVARATSNTVFASIRRPHARANTIGDMRSAASTPRGREQRGHMGDPVGEGPTALMRANTAPVRNADGRPPRNSRMCVVS